MGNTKFTVQVGSKNVEFLLPEVAAERLQTMLSDEISRLKALDKDALVKAKASMASRWCRNSTASSERKAAASDLFGGNLEYYSKLYVLQECRKAFSGAEGTERGAKGRLKTLYGKRAIELSEKEIAALDIVSLYTALDDLASDKVKASSAEEVGKIVAQNAAVKKEKASRIEVRDALIEKIKKGHKPTAKEVQELF